MITAGVEVLHLKYWDLLMFQLDLNQQAVDDFTSKVGCQSKNCVNLRSFQGSHSEATQGHLHYNRFICRHLTSLGNIRVLSAL